MISDDLVTISYQYTTKDDNTYSYVSMEVVNVDDTWKVQWIGIEK